MDNLRSLTFFDIYEANGSRLGDKPAINWRDKDYTYSELFDKTSKLAKGLQELQLDPGSRIAVLCQNHPAFFHLFGAAAALNLVLVLVNRRLSQDEIDYIITDTTPRIIISDTEMAPIAKKLTATHSFLAKYFIVESDDTETDFSQLYHSLPLEKAVSSRMDDPFIIIHTAAVQGQPRGAVLGHGNVILSNQQVIHTFELDPSQTYLNILPLFHVMGVNLGLGSLQAGGKNVILEKFNAEKTLDLIQSQKVNLIGSFPPILNTLLEASENGNYTLSSLRIAAGLEIPETVKKWESITDSKFWTMYGQTETSGLITFSEYFERPGSAGKISTLATINIVDDLDKILPTGETGEIVVRGPLVFQGYWNAEELNAHTFRNGWHHTGDLGMIDADGFLFFKGRKAEKELIKPGGENVFPAEVEKAILEHDAIKDVCVFGVPDPKFGEGIKAVCSLQQGADLTKEDLIKFCGSRIAGYKKPRYVEFIDALPRTKDGTIDREKIKADHT